MRNEFHTYGERHLGRDARGFQCAGLRVYREHYDAIPVLSGDETKLTVGVDVEVARSLDPFGLMASRRQFAVLGIDAEDSDAVMAAIGAIEKLAAGMHHDLRRVAGAGEVLGQGGDRLCFGERALVGVVAESDDGVVQLVDDVSELAVGMEREMARPRAWRN